MIERLSFADSARYNAIEAASHLARYMLARAWAPGRRVLDVACGEGYGAYLLAAQWGAASVDAVDLAPEAIAAARANFAHPRIRFHEHDAMRLTELFAGRQFDLIVSLETIEHVPDAEGFLAELARLRAPNGCVILSCPNDWWYYRSAEERNPFHVRKFRLEEFLALGHAAFGPPREVLLGTPLAGFTNCPRGSADLKVGGGTDHPRALLTAHACGEHLVLPSDEEVSAANCSYFAAVWGDSPEHAGAGTAALFPCSMTASMQATQAASIEALRDEVVHLRTELHAARAEAKREAERIAALDRSRAELEHALVEARDAKTELRDALDRAERARREAELRLAAVQAEHEYVQEQAFRTRCHAEWLEQQVQTLERQRTALEQQAQTLEQQRTALEEQRTALAARVADLERTWGNRIWGLGRRIFHRLRGRR